MKHFRPSLPSPMLVLSAVGQLLPTRIHGEVLARVLNRLLAPELADGELDFLNGQIVLIEVIDARIRYRLTLRNGMLAALGDDGPPAALRIGGNVHDFLLLASRQEDADTLFFHRRLTLGGNTELGLYVKNFLDSLELEERLGPVLKLLHGATTWVGRFA